MDDLKDPTQQPQKPLPPQPRKSSSAYTLARYAEEVPYNASTYNGSNTTEYSSTEYLEPKAYRSSTSEIPDAIPQRPKLIQTPLSHALSEPLVEHRRPRQTLPRDEEVWIAKEQSELPHMQRPNGTKFMDAKQFADDYESILATRSSTLPNIAADPYYPGHGDKASPMSPRIIDVVDHSLVPSPLRFDTSDEVEEPPSRFSSDSSDSTSLRGGLGDTLRKKAREAFHSHRGTPEPNDSQHLPQSSKKPKSRVSSGASHRRVSLQHGLDDMYDTLASLYVHTPKSKPATPKATVLALENSPNMRSPRAAREQRSPAIPITPYQQIGSKAWELEKGPNPSKINFKHSFGSKESRKEGEVPTSPTSRPSSPSKSNKASKAEGSKQPGLAHRFASRLQNGTEKIEQAMGFETNRVKRTKSQKRREELKKKIVIIGLGDREQAGGGRWL